MITSCYKVAYAYHIISLAQYHHKAAESFFDCDTLQSVHWFDDVYVAFQYPTERKIDKNLANIDVVVGAKGKPTANDIVQHVSHRQSTGNITIKEATPLLRKRSPSDRMGSAAFIG